MPALDAVVEGEVPGRHPVPRVPALGVAAVAPAHLQPEAAATAASQLLGTISRLVAQDEQTEAVAAVA